MRSVKSKKLHPAHCHPDQREESRTSNERPRSFSTASSIVLVLTLLLLATPWWMNVSAQVADSTQFNNQQSIDDAKEILLQQQEQQSEEGEGNFEELEDALTFLSRNPLDLNRAGDEELYPLVETGLMNELQLKEFISYRNLFGPFISIYELQAVPSLQVDDIAKLLPYVRVVNQIGDYNAPLRRLLTQGDASLLVRYQRVLEQQEGFIEDTLGNSKYLGSPDVLYARFRYAFGTRLSYGVTMQKDAGEQFFKGTQQNGFDFYSAHLFFRTNRLFKAVALGDYQIKAGQGLVLGSGIGGRKSAYVMQVVKSGRTLKPYTGANEYLFFRGAATTLGYKRFEFTPFFSYKKVDASLDTALVVNEEGDVFTTAIGQDGYHRTLSEVAKKNSISQIDGGGILQYNSRKLTAGATHVHTGFSKPIQPTRSTYNQFRFSGKELINTSLFYNYHFGNVLLFGEGAISDNGGKAFLQGLMATLSQRVDAAIVYRNFAKNYQSLYANAFAESTTPDNERGLYVALSMKPYSGFTLDVYADRYTKQWLSFQRDAPSRGTDYLGRLTWQPNKRTVLYTQYKIESQQQNSSAENKIDYLVNTRKQNLRFHLSTKASPFLSLASRAEAVWYKTDEDQKTRQGFLAYQDVVFKTLSFPLSLTLRYAIFNTDDYDTRIYTYENEVLYVYSIPSFSGRGARYYAIVRYSVNRHLDIWVRGAQTSYYDRDEVGSGNDVINGSAKTDIKIEARWRF